MGDFDCAMCGLPGWVGKNGGIRGFTSSGPVCQCYSVFKRTDYTTKPITRFGLWKLQHPKRWKVLWITCLVVSAFLAPVILGFAVFFGFKLLILLLEVVVEPLLSGVDGK